jgi:hypothetical protein
MLVVLARLQVQTCPRICAIKELKTWNSIFERSKLFFISHVAKSVYISDKSYDLHTSVPTESFRAFINAVHIKNCSRTRFTPGAHVFLDEKKILDFLI